MSSKKTFRTGEGHVLGDRTFAAITAVEGISLSNASRNRIQSMRKRQLSPAQQRDEVIRAFTEAKTRQ